LFTSWLLLGIDPATWMGSSSFVLLNHVMFESRSRAVNWELSATCSNSRRQRLQLGLFRALQVLTADAGPI
jgi:hypothetical protein